MNYEQDVQIVITPFSNEVYSVLFAVVLLYVLTQKSILSKLLSGKILGFVGDISYGVYMFNPFTILLTIEIYQRLGWNAESRIFAYGVFYALAVSLTVIISYLSYRFIEFPNMRLKKYNQ